MSKTKEVKDELVEENVTNPEADKEAPQTFTAEDIAVIVAREVAKAQAEAEIKAEAVAKAKAEAEAKEASETRVKPRDQKAFRDRVAKEKKVDFYFDPMYGNTVGSEYQFSLNGVTITLVPGKTHVLPVSVVKYLQEFKLPHIQEHHSNNGTIQDISR